MENLLTRSTKTQSGIWHDSLSRAAGNRTVILEESRVCDENRCEEKGIFSVTKPIAQRNDIASATDG